METLELAKIVAGDDADLAVGHLLKFNDPSITDPFKLAQLGFAATRIVMERKKDALPVLSRALDGNWQNIAALDRVACAWLYAKFSTLDWNEAEILEMCATLKARFGEFPAPLLYKGAMALRNERREEAYGLFNRAKALADGGLCRLYVGAYSLPEYDSIFSWAERSSGRPAGVIDKITWIKRPGKSGDMCVYAAGDNRYFIRFARSLVESIRATGSNCPVHFHVVNWNEECAGVLAGCDEGVSISAENYRYVKDITFFATARFNRASEIMEALGSPLYIVDLDLTFKAAPKLDNLRQFDIAYRFGGGDDWFPWWGPTAKYVFLNNSNLGRKIAGWMHCYFNSRFRPNIPRETWWFDQLMLNEIGYWLHRHGYSSVIGDMLDRRIRFADDLPPESTEGKRAFT